MAAKITNEMLNEAGVMVLTKRVLKSVIKDGPRITQITTSEGDSRPKSSSTGLAPHRALACGHPGLAERQDPDRLRAHHGRFPDLPGRRHR